MVVIMKPETYYIAGACVGSIVTSLVGQYLLAKKQTASLRDMGLAVGSGIISFYTWPLVVTSGVTWLVARTIASYRS